MVVTDPVVVGFSSMWFILISELLLDKEVCLDWYLRSSVTNHLLHSLSVAAGDSHSNGSPNRL